MEIISQLKTSLVRMTRILSMQKVGGPFLNLYMFQVLVVPEKISASNSAYDFQHMIVVIYKIENSLSTVWRGDNTLSVVADTSPDPC